MLYKTFSHNTGLTEDGDLETRLNSLAADGWEILSVCPYPSHDGFGGDYIILARKAKE